MSSTGGWYLKMTPGFLPVRGVGLDWGTGTATDDLMLWPGWLSQRTRYLDCLKAVLAQWLAPGAGTHTYLSQLHTSLFRTTPPGGT